MVVKINSVVGGIKRIRLNGSGDPLGLFVRAVGAHFRAGHALAAQVPAALALIGCRGASPQEAFRESVHI